MKKAFWKSKSFWFGAVTFAGSMFPSVQQYVAENPQAFGMVWGGIALILRLVTKDKVVLVE